MHMQRIRRLRTDSVTPTITSNASVSVEENATLAHTLTASESVTWAIRTAVQDAASLDHDEFELSGSTLRWSSNGTRDYETPSDTNTNNAYVVVVRATDTAGNTADQTITVTVTDVSEGDPSYASVVFLSYFDGVDGATAATEEKGKALTFAGNAQLDTAAKKFGTASLLLDGTGDWVTAADSGDFTLPGEFTIEMWFRPNGTAGTQGLLSHSAGTNPNQNFVLRYEYSSATQKRLTFLFFPTGSSASLVTVQHALEDIDHAVFHHVAVTRDASDNVRLFLDGVLKDTETATGGANVASTLNIGAVGGLLSPFNGWIDSLRITKGVCRYTAGFTPPATDFLNS
jgi:hypothetical protein